jgi:DNA repair protein RadC
MKRDESKGSTSQSGLCRVTDRSVLAMKPAMPDARTPGRSSCWGFSVSEKLALYGSSSLSGVEHLQVLVGKDSLADALLRHFGSLKALSRASFKELRQFLPQRKAEAVMAALSVATIAETEHALSAPLANAKAIYKANLDMKAFHQEVVRVVLLDSQLRCITKVEIAKGTVNECFAHPREISRPAITHASFAFVLVHNHPSGLASPSAADLQLTKRIAEGARILNINFLDHVIVGQPSGGRSGYYSFRKQGFCETVSTGARRSIFVTRSGRQQSWPLNGLRILLGVPWGKKLAIVRSWRRVWEQFLLRQFGWQNRDIQRAWWLESGSLCKRSRTSQTRQLSRIN